MSTVNWSTWKPQERATLCFVRQNNRVLLIRKKRGLGAGKINGFGGKLEKGEALKECVVREGKEELNIEVMDPVQCGELHFQFTDGYSLHCTVYIATSFQGIPEETAEAAPLWFGLDSLPFGEMWEDDRLWLDKALDLRRFKGFFLFDGERMLSQFVEWEEASSFPV